jgi:peptidoglycan/LPS O-acetylase OafA/YrhL
MNPQPSHRILGADTVRALATLWVFAGHLFVLEPALKAIDSPWTRLLRPGFLGVAAFFVLSGFLLSMPFWRAFAARSGPPDLKRYLRNRLTRIVPEYYVCVLVMALIAGAFTTRWGLIQVAGCLTFTNALLPPTYMPTWNAPLWSIGIEMSFYLFLPVVAVGIFRCRSRRTARVLVVSLMGLIALGQPLFLWAAPHLERAIGNESLFSATSSSTVKNAVVLFAHFLIGMIAADVYLSRPLRSTARRFNVYDLLVLASTSIIGISLLTQTQLPGLGYMHYQWPTFPALIGVLLVCLPLSATCGRWIEGRFIRTTATLSYGIYIWHIPIFYGLKHIWPSTPDGRISLLAIYALTALVCCYAASAISYRFVGRPALNRMRAREPKHPQRPILTHTPRKLAA